MPKFNPLHSLRDIINIILDWIYPLFKRFMTKQVFRYAATGGANVGLDIILYAIVYKFILAGSVLDLGFVTLSAHIAAFVIVFPITFITGFAFAKYITFTESTLNGRKQLFRYLTTVIGSILLNYILLKLFVDILQFDAVLANILNKIIVICYSYFAQTYFSFRKEKKLTADVNSSN